MMKKIVLSLLFLLVAVTANAQRNQGRRFETPQEFHKGAIKEQVQKRAEKLAEDFKLAQGDAEWFVDLYTTMQDTLFSMREKRFSVGEKKEKEYTDEEYTQLVEDSFRQQMQEVQLRHNYYIIMSERLTPAQLYRVFLGDKTGRQMRQSQQNGTMPAMPMGPGGFPGGFPGRPF